MAYFRFIVKLTRLRMWREAALTIGAVLGTICIVATIAAVAFDVRPLVFRSGSMSPAIETGALAFAVNVPATELEAGDIVSVIDSKGTRVTHRIVEIDGADDRASLTLRGDANESADAQPYVVASADRVLFDIPKAGYVVSWLNGPAGIFAGGLLCGLLLFIAFGPGPRSNGRGKSRVHAASLAVVALGLGGLAGTGLGRAAPTMAAWDDSATATSGTLKTYTVPAPANFTCTGGLAARPKFTWDAVPGATGYRITYTGGPPGGQFLDSSIRTFRIPGAVLGLLGAGDVTVSTIREFGSPVTTTWRSVETVSIHYTYLLGLLGILVSSTCPA